MNTKGNKRPGSLLLDSKPIMVSQELAVLIGLNEAIVLQQVHYWCCFNEKTRKNYRNGFYWTYMSYPNWNTKEFPWWGITTVKTTFRNLENKGLLISGVFNKSGMDRTKWYRVNYDALEELNVTPSDGIHPMDGTESDRPIPKNKKKNKNSFFEEKPMQENPARVDGSNIDIDKFIDWYFAEYEQVFETRHPNIRANQRNRIMQVLNDFLNDPEFDSILDLGIDGLHAMVEAFFYDTDSNDWRINHFATPGVLKTQYYAAGLHR